MTSKISLLGIGRSHLKSTKVWLDREALLWFVYLIFLVLFLIMGTSMLPLKAIAGMIALLFIPGFLLVDKILPEESLTQKAGLSVVIGMMFQFLIITGIFVVGHVFFYKRMNFQAAFLSLNICLMIVLSLLRIRHFSKDPTKENVFSKTSKKHSDLKINAFLLVVFLLTLSTRFYFQGFASTDWVGPDSAGFLDMGRNILNAEFSPKSTEGRADFHYFDNRNTDVGHLMACFAYALFFLFAGVNINAGMLMVATVGSLIMFPLYGATKELLGRKAANIAILLAAAHPYLINYSALVFGYEILGTLLVLSMSYFVLLALKERKPSKICAVIAGILLFLIGLTGLQFFYVFMVSTSLIFLLLNAKNGIRDIVVGVFLLGGLFVTSWKFFSAFSSPTPLWVWVVILSYPVINVLIYFMRAREKRHGWMTFLHLMSLSSYALIILYGLRFLIWFLHPEFVEPVPGVTHPPYLSTVLGSMAMFENFFEKFIAFCRIGWFHWTALISIAGLAALVIPIEWRKKAWIFMYPLSYTIIITLKGSFLFFPLKAQPPIILSPLIDPNYLRSIRWGWLNKLALDSTPYILMASALTIGFVAEKAIPLKKIIFRIKCLKRGKKFVLETPQMVVTAILIILIIQFVPYYHYYRLRSWDPECPNPTFGHGLYAKYQSVYDWIEKHTEQSAVLMARPPREVCWYTDRMTVGVLSPWGESYDEIVRGLNFTGLEYLIRKYHVNYLIVDDEWVQQRPVTPYLLNPARAPLCFHVVFRNETSIHHPGFVMIYNVTDVWKRDIRLAFNYNPMITDCDSTMNWEVHRGSGFVTVDSIDRVEGNGSIDCIGTTDSDGFFGVIYSPLGSWNWTIKPFVSVWLKLDNATKFDSFEFAYYDINANRYHYRLEARCLDWNTGKWFHAILPLDDYDYVYGPSPSDTPDMEHIDKIYIVVHYGGLGGGKAPLSVELHIDFCTLASWNLKGEK